MKIITGLLVIGAAIVLGIWYWRKNVIPSPLDVHYADLTQRQLVGNLNQKAAFLSTPPLAMLGEGWGTACRVNKNAGYQQYNKPLPTRWGFRFAQPGV